MLILLLLLLILLILLNNLGPTRYFLFFLSSSFSSFPPFLHFIPIFLFVSFVLLPFFFFLSLVCPFFLFVLIFNFQVFLPATTPPSLFNLSIPTLLEGNFALICYQNDSLVSPSDVPYLFYYVIDTTPVVRTSENMQVLLLLQLFSSSPFLSSSFLSFPLFSFSSPFSYTSSFFLLIILFSQFQFNSLTV